MEAKKAQVTVDAPRFQSEAEEAAWWDRHQDLIADLLVKHGRRGAVPTQMVSVRLPVPDVQRAKKLADQQGVGSSTVIRNLLHEILQEKEKLDQTIQALESARSRRSKKSPSEAAPPEKRMAAGARGRPPAFPKGSRKKRT